MASVRHYCDCMVRRIGTATIDCYKIYPFDKALAVLDGTATCRHCGAVLKQVGGRGCLTVAQADMIDALVPTEATQP